MAENHESKKFYDAIHAFDALDTNAQIVIEKTVDRKHSTMLTILLMLLMLSILLILMLI